MAYWLLLYLQDPLYDFYQSRVIFVSLIPGIMKEKTTTSLESEAGFRVLFQYATIGIVVVGDRGRIQIVNPSAEELFGYSNAELIGQSIEVLIPDHLKKKHEQHRENYFHAPKARPMGLGMELYAKKKSGEIFPVEISLGHYELSGEKLAVAFVTDITKRKEAEQKLKKINEELENRVKERTLELSDALERQKEMNDMKSRFVSMASHEFRTPLSAVLSSISLIEQYIGRGEEEKQRKHIDRIKASVKNMTGILNDFLSLDKLEQNKVEVEKGSFNLPEFAEDIAEELQGIMKKGQRIAYSHKGAETIVQDKKILRNIFLNLLSNAVKYSEENKEIHFSTTVQDYRATVVIKDNGIGIPYEEQKHLFGKFFRATNVDTIQGTGLGLNIVKRYVDLIYGSVRFTSTPGEGTTFTVEFPISD